MKHILVIEDEPEVCEVICALLEDSGYTTVSASNGSVALDIVGQQEFDLVLTDLVMPGMEGVETMAALRRVAPKLRVIAMSGIGSYLDMAKAVGASMTLLKPFTRDQLVETVESVLAA